MLRAISVLLLLLFPVTVFAHAPRKGPNGGTMSDAGSRYHAELVAVGTPEIVVFLYDANDQPISTEGFRANAVLVVDGQTLRFALQSGGGPKMTGVAPVSVPAGVKGAVQLTAPDGTTAQARF